MSEHKSTAVLNRSATVEQRRLSLAERVWHGADALVRGRLNHAALRLRDSGEKLTPERVASLARAQQERHLRGANTEGWTTSELTANRVSLLMLEMPFAAKAVVAIDRKSAQTRAEREEQKDAVIQFNHDFTETLTAMSSAMLASFPDQVWSRTRDMADKMGMSILPKERYNGVVKGITREVAFARALVAEAPEEWEFRNSTVEEEKEGVDAVIENDGLALNFDLKAAKSYQNTLAKHRDAGRLSDAEYEIGLADGYVDVPMTNSRRGEYKVCLVDADSLGAIDTFEYQDPTAVTEFIEARFAERRQDILQKASEYAINN